MNVLSVLSVNKTFGDYKAVDNLTFEVSHGKIFGILGPNGAGKTTTIRMINNIIAPDDGEIRIFGEKIKPEHQNKIGYLPEERGLYKKLKVIEQLIYFGQLKGLSRAEAYTNASLWLKRLDAEDWKNKKIQELSKGMQQKVQFISTILHNPDLLILDEPFSGFDPINVEVLKSVILDLKSDGKTILLSTHVMQQVEELCDEIVLINKGRKILSGNVHQIKKNYGNNNVLLEFEGDESFIKDIQDIEIININNNRVEINLKNSDVKPVDILRKALNSGIEIYKFQLIEPSLHEIFIDVVTKQGNSNE